ncbi:MAG TPA: DUF916 domain-containing protein [Candidatus Saccharimonadales bacterium]|nr:DUF916 domain-containing protein [Candidatus Saccharimonadales bacterium]
MALGVLTICLVAPIPAWAQVSTNSQAAGLTVSPVVDEFTVNPGATVTRIVHIINPVAQTITLYPVVYNFTTDNQEGRPQFYTSTEKSSTFAMSDWVSFGQSSITIAPGQSQIFQINITAPTTAEPGGHYGAILFSTEKPTTTKNSNQVSVVGLIGTLLLATVPGNLVQIMDLEDFNAPTFLVKGPANFSLLFSNTGNIHLKPIGQIKIRNWFGNTNALLDVNAGHGNVLPQSKRHFDNSWDFDWKAVGKFTATATVTFGDPQQQATLARTFWIIPWWLIITVAALVTLILLWIILAASRKRRRNKIRPDTLPTFSAPRDNQPPKKKFIMR